MWEVQSDADQVTNLKKKKIKVRKKHLFYSSRFALPLMIYFARVAARPPLSGDIGARSYILFNTIHDYRDEYATTIISIH